MSPFIAMSGLFGSLRPTLNRYIADWVTADRRVSYFKRTLAQLEWAEDVAGARWPPFISVEFDPFTEDKSSYLVMEWPDACISLRNKLVQVHVGNEVIYCKPGQIPLAWIEKLQQHLSAFNAEDTIVPEKPTPRRR